MPSAYPSFQHKRIIADGIYPCTGGPGAIYVAADANTSWSARFVGGSPDWIDLQGPTSGTGDALLKFSVDINPDSNRSATLEIVESQSRRKSKHLIRQASGVSSKLQQDQVLELPFLEVPRIMELGIAGKFIAAQIQKIPEPFDLIALLIVEVVVALGGVLTATLRGAIPSELIPTPKPVFPLPPLPPPSPLPIPSFIDTSQAESFLMQIPITPAFILEQTATLCAYIAIETFDSE